MLMVRSITSTLKIRKSFSSKTAEWWRPVITWYKERIRIGQKITPDAEYAWQAVKKLRSETLASLYIFMRN
jgi:hypothetical protein